MNGVGPTQKTTGGARIGEVRADQKADPASTPKLRAPDVVRQGEVPKQRSRWPSLLKGAVLTATTAALLATALPINEGGALADPAAVEEIHTTETAPAQAPVRGQVTTAPDSSGRAGFWLTPMAGQLGLPVQGELVDRIWLAEVGSPEAEGLRAGQLGELDPSRMQAVKVVETAEGREAYAAFPAGETVLAATQLGLPRDVEGVVRRGAAPGAPDGAEADHLYLQLEEGAAVYLNGERFTDVVHLGAAGDPALAGLEPGARASVGARLQPMETAEGPLASVASVVSLAVSSHEAAPAEAPFFKEGTFYSMDERALPTLTLGGDGEVLVLDALAGRAYRGAVSGGAFEGFEESYPLTTHLSGGPEIELRDGSPTIEGRALERLDAQNAGQPAEKESGWFRDTKTGDVLRLAFGAEDARARVTASFNAP